MINIFKTTEFTKCKRVAGLHCAVYGNDMPTFSYIVLVKHKGKIEIEHQATFQCEIEKLSENISTKLPLFLSLEGRGILHKQVDPDPSRPIIQQVIPNANEEDFIFEQFEGSQQSVVISFSRKSYVDEILGKFATQKFAVIGLTISPFSVTWIFELFPGLPARILTGSFELETDKVTGSILRYQKLENENLTDQHYTLADNQITSRFILPFYSALTYYTNTGHRPEYAVVAFQKEEFVSKRQFIFFSWIILTFLFLILFANLLVFTNISEKKQFMETKVSTNMETLNTLKKVKEELLWKEKFLGQAGVDRKKWLSYFADQLAASVPEEITLEKLELHPVTTKIRKLKEIEIQPDAVQIEGVTKNSLAVNNWAVSLKKMDWISNVIVENFSQLENSTLGVFSIEITLTSPKPKQ